MTCLNIEIRELEPVEIYKLGVILSVSDNWKKLIAIVPKQENVPKFSSEHIEMIEQAAHQHNRNAAEIFLYEWSTMGKKRPTLALLLDVLILAELYRAADYVACDLLKKERPRRPQYGPIASIDTSDATIHEILEEQMLPKDILDDSVVLVSSFKLEVNKIYHDDLQEAANKNLLEATNDALICKKSTDATGEIVSDLMKFTITDSCEAMDKHVAHSMVSIAEEQLPVPIIFGDSKEPPNIRKQYWQEVTSQELPVFVNNLVQSTVPNEEVPSEHLPVFLNSVQSTMSNKEASSEYLPVFLDNSIQSATFSNKKMP